MGHILKVRADAISINITLNSFDTFYNQPSHRASSRKALYPSFGYLYPEGIEMLVRPAPPWPLLECPVCVPLHSILPCNCVTRAVQGGG